jgi:hypothetical protein
MEINLDNENNIKNKKLYEDKQEEEYENFYKKEQLKVSLINIDSMFRNKSPKNIYTSSINYLPKDPLTFILDSQIIEINYPNNGFNENDKIIIQNVEGKSYILSGEIYLFQNYSYCFIKINHDYTTNYKNLLNKLQIEISVVNSEMLNTKQFYGNIPINSLIGIFDINLPSIVNETNEIPQSILTDLSSSTVENLDSSYILIKLPFNYFAYDNLNNRYEVTDFFKISFNDLYGLPINGINADYPINYQKEQGYHEVLSVLNKDNFTIKTSYKALKNGIGGGTKIQIMKITSIEEGYPDANNYIIKLKENFNNVVRIELISTEFPFIDYLIKNSGPNKNNKIYWKHLDDGNYIYSAEIPEGNYDGENLILLLMKNMNAIERITSTPEKKIFNDFLITYNLFTQEVTFSAFKTENIPNSLKVDIVTIDSIQYFKLIVNHPNNLVEINDLVTIFNASAIGIVTSNFINKTHTVFEINKNNNNYSILLGTINQISTSNNDNDLTQTLTDTGGASINIKTKARISLLFNYKDTIGSIIGFKNVGQANAITDYKNIISNFDSYLNDTKLNTVGNIVETPLLLNFTGNNNYYLLYLNDYELVNNSYNQSPAFAKILLSGTLGDILYNTFINFPIEFDFPISTLNEIKIKITYGDGSLPDFRNIDHSFTLKIVELVNFPKYTGINSKKTNFISTLKKLKM